MNRSPPPPGLFDGYAAARVVIALKLAEDDNTLSLTVSLANRSRFLVLHHERE